MCFFGWDRLISSRQKERHLPLFCTKDVECCPWFWMWPESSAVAKFLEAHGNFWSKGRIFQLLCLGVPGLISLLESLDAVMWRSVEKSGKRVRLFTPQHGRTVRGNGHQQKWERFRLVRKKGFTVRITEHWRESCPGRLHHFLPQKFLRPDWLKPWVSWS